MQTASATDIGRIRLLNEDSFFVQNHSNEFSVAIVADGMGGHRAGDMASQTAIEAIAPHLSNIPAGSSIEECKEIIRAAVYQANQLVYELSLANPDLHGMGTTVAIAVATSKWFIVAHVGDSRVYLLENSVKRLHQLTADHSLVSELVKSGQLAEEEVATHPHRNVLTRAVGTDQHVALEVGNWMWNEGDLLLLCSDGLSNMVKEANLNHILSQPIAIDEKAKALIQAALAGGGDDNITVALISNESNEQGGE
jgi:serine/threonine protein phosphatase PrpC